MSKKYTQLMFITFLALIPFGVVWSYFQHELQYANSPHLSTVWNKKDPVLEITKETSLTQDFEVIKEGLNRIDVRLRKGDGDYNWYIKKNPLNKESIVSGSFDGNDVQNYDFISLLFDTPLYEFINQDLWLVIERADDAMSPGVAVFGTEGDSGDVVFQVYYSE